MRTVTTSRLARTAATLLVGVAILLPASAEAVSAATVTDRTFSCAGSLGDIYTAYTITGSLTSTNQPHDVTTTQTATGEAVTAAGKLPSLGASALHAGFVAWSAGANLAGDTYALHVPPVLPGAGGFFDADLEVQYGGGQFGSNQIPMFDCAVSGGPLALANPSGTRTFSCTGSLGLARTQRTVTGTLNKANQPGNVVVTDAAGVVGSSRKRPTSLGASALHAGYAAWDVTGGPAVAATDTYALHIPPVLPKAGGFFDADLEINFAGGANGSWQIPMFDCTVK